jgi:hypothetical protein
MGHQDYCGRGRQTVLSASCGTLPGGGEAAWRRFCFSGPDELALNIAIQATRKRVLDPSNAGDEEQVASEIKI